MSAFQLAIVGAGPRGIGVLERISANAAEFARGRRIVVHLIDPYPPGPGRIWRYAQSPLLRMNSMPEDVTMFTDDTVRMDGPVSSGPSLAEWAENVRRGRLPVRLPADVEAELASLTGRSFPTRRLQSAYLSWVYDHVRTGLPDTIEIREHRVRATAITGAEPGWVWLEGASRPLRADATVLTVGHIDAEPDRAATELAAFAERAGLSYYPPGYTADVDYSAVAPGEPVIVRGFGLAFVDLMLLLTEGRGGRFDRLDTGTLRYVPSGAEPVLHVGSRRGVPYHAKPGYALGGALPPLPRFFGEATVRELAERTGSLDFRRDVWPHVAKEIAWGYYSELLTSHPHRVHLARADFEARFAEAGWDSPAMRSLVKTAVPAYDDRLDLTALDRPLEGRTFDTAEDFGKYLRSHIEADLGRRANPAFSADLGAFVALLSVYGQLAALVATGKIGARSQLSDLDGWWHGFFSFFASGPPPQRLAELLALQEAGIVHFLGSGLRVGTDTERRLFLADGASFPGTFSARTLIEARLPSPSVTAAADPLLRSLYESGRLTEETIPEQPGPAIGSGRIHTRDGRMIDVNGHVHRNLFALGPHTSTRSAGAFTRPRANALSLRQNDMVARRILALAATYR
ncbi:adenylate cyclase [Prauserella marina]|uniref:FAD-NAD(P)-binding n=1 Tax=Prauserella marina TaxID=530584 RepID=A0A222VPQ0_9PSEU|nr:FAD/NAD(P)-binding protein [Prauserella marina]ASR35899.1 adenylate cyclase [Prauserella marina]PWV84178.1 FAD-NAD(P)-binding protein [Prauserella marina]SDC28670.1 FAD-NAD(P)-binding [Prauserella marina]